MLEAVGRCGAIARGGWCEGEAPQAMMPRPLRRLCITDTVASRMLGRDGRPRRHQGGGAGGRASALTHGDAAR